MTLEIRPALADELLPCAELFEEVAAEPFHWLPLEFRTAEAMLKTFAEEEVFVAVRGENLVGFLSFYRPDSFVHSLFVREQGQGVGRALLARALAEAGGPISLKCADKNVGGLRFYDRLGYVEIERGVDPTHSWTRLRSPISSSPLRGEVG